MNKDVEMKSHDDDVVFSLASTYCCCLFLACCCLLFRRYYRICIYCCLFVMTNFGELFKSVSFEAHILLAKRWSSL